MIYYRIINMETYLQYYATISAGGSIELDPNCLNDGYSGIYFTTIQNIFAYLDYGPILCKITIPDDAIIIAAGERMSISSPYIEGYRTNKIIIESFMNLTALDTIKYLISEGADISMDDYKLFRWASYYQPEILLYLKLTYCDIYEKYKTLFLE